MKKTILTVFAAAALLVSCAKMSPEATQAWNDFKAKAAAVATDEAVAQFESPEEYEAAFEAALNAGIEFGKNFDGKVTQEVADSFAMLNQTLIEHDKKVKEAIAAQQALEEETEEEFEEETEEEVEE
jgi:hypothetical protein